MHKYYYEYCEGWILRETFSDIHIMIKSTYYTIFIGKNHIFHSTLSKLNEKYE